jgi:hypothetical protein
MTMLQNLIVFLIVVAAALYALWRWLPLAWRLGVTRRLAAVAQRAGLIDAQRAQRLSTTLARSSDCASCSQCTGCGSGKPADTRVDATYRM